MIIAIDTETGGLEPGKSALLSISACMLDNPTHTFSVFIRPDPQLIVENQAALVNGYTPEGWAKRGAVTLQEALYRFKSWLPYSNNEPLAHNAGFDKAFMESAERQANYKLYLKYRWRCSMSAFMFVNDALGLKAPDFKLETLARMAGHWKPDYQRGAHQSLDDVVACAAGWRWLVQQIRQEKAAVS